MQMNSMNSKVWVFKTSISSKDITCIKGLMNDLMTIDDKWNVDLEDRDNILRVESSIQPIEIIRNLQQAGFACEELED